LGKHKQEDLVQAGWGIKPDPVSKITRAKKAGGVAQVVECKCKAQVQAQYCQERKRKQICLEDRNNLIIGKLLLVTLHQQTYFTGCHMFKCYFSFEVPPN
jgi:hypothetical protein